MNKKEREWIRKICLHARFTGGAPKAMLEEGWKLLGETPPLLWFPEGSDTVYVSGEWAAKEGVIDKQMILDKVFGVR